MKSQASCPNESSKEDGSKKNIKSVRRRSDAMIFELLR